MEELYKKLAYEFRDPSLLMTALTHSSYANENKRLGLDYNERLEFLGDSILGMVVARELYLHFPGMPEGKMSRLRSELVCEQSLHGVAQQLQLGKYMRLGKGEDRNGGRERPSILADAVEAVLAAMFLDGGLEPAAKVIYRYILTPFENGRAPDMKDYKTALQEVAQCHGAAEVSYTLVSASGPDHSKVFTMSVCIDGRELGQGTGRSKKEAEMEAAKAALKTLQEESHG